MLVSFTFLLSFHFPRPSFFPPPLSFFSLLSILLFLLYPINSLVLILSSQFSPLSPLLLEVIGQRLPYHFYPLSYSLYGLLSISLLSSLVSLPLPLDHRSSVLHHVYLYPISSFYFYHINFLLFCFISSYLCSSLFLYFLHHFRSPFFVVYF